MKSFVNFMGGKTPFMIFVIIYSVIITNVIISEVWNFTSSILMSISKIVFVSVVTGAIMILTFRILTLIGRKIK